MKFMVAWAIPPENHNAAITAFLAGGAPMPDGLVALGRWHAPGSQRGWLLCETKDPGILYEHIAEWSSLLTSHVTPVVDDEMAATALAKVRSRKTN